MILAASITAHGPALPVPPIPPRGPNTRRRKRRNENQGFTGDALQWCGASLVKGKTMEKMITAIRNDKAVGIGSCSVIDECYTDAELIEALTERNITTTRKALQWAKAFNKLFWEQQKEMSGW